MSNQESALYGDLVLRLRDHAAELLADEHCDVDTERERLDRFIHDWFFTPQDDLHGCAPRELIWAELEGEPNPIDPEHLHDFFVDDCPICQAEFNDIAAALEAGQDPGWDWYYDDGGYPLIARYDPQGWEACWIESEAASEGWHVNRELPGLDGDSPAAEAYTPCPIEGSAATPEEFVARLRQPWIDPALQDAAQLLTDRLDCPEPSVFGLRYRRITYEESLSLLVGLYEHGVDVEGLLAQLDAFPYQNIALDWLSRPTENAALVVEAMEHEIPSDDRAEMVRLRHHRDFIFTLARVIPEGARLWLQGWLDAVAHGVLARAIRDEE